MGIVCFPIGASGYPIAANSQIAANLVIKQVEKQTVAAAASLSHSGLTGKKYKIVFTLTRGTAAAALKLTVNGLATNTYRYAYIQVVGATLTSNGLTAQPSITMTTTPGGTNEMSGEITIELTTNGHISVSGIAGAEVDNEFRVIQGGNNTAGQTNINTITITPTAGVITGNSVLYELEA